MGEILGQAYVKKYFTPEAKARALEMVNNMEAELRDDGAAHLDDGRRPREGGLAKLEAIAKKIGYPDTWRDYSALTVDRGSFALNSRRARGSRTSASSPRSASRWTGPSGA